MCAISHDYNFIHRYEGRTGDRIVAINTKDLVAGGFGMNPIWSVLLEKFGPVNKKLTRLYLKGVKREDNIEEAMELDQRRALRRRRND